MDELKMLERAKHNGPKEITNVIKETTEAKVKEEVAKKISELSAMAEQLRCP